MLPVAAVAAEPAGRAIATAAVAASTLAPCMDYGLPGTDPSDVLSPSEECQQAIDAGTHVCIDDYNTIMGTNCRGTCGYCPSPPPAPSPGQPMPCPELGDFAIKTQVEDCAALGEDTCEHSYKIRNDGSYSECYWRPKHADPHVWHHHAAGLVPSAVAAAHAAAEPSAADAATADAACRRRRHRTGAAACLIARRPTSTC